MEAEAKFVDSSQFSHYLWKLEIGQTMNLLANHKLLRPTEGSPKPCKSTSESIPCHLYMPDEDRRHEWIKHAGRSLQNEQKQDWKGDQKSHKNKLLIWQVMLIAQKFSGCKSKTALWNRYSGPSFYNQKSQHFRICFMKTFIWHYTLNMCVDFLSHTFLTVSTLYILSLGTGYSPAVHNWPSQSLISRCQNWCTHNTLQL